MGPRNSIVAVVALAAVAAGTWLSFRLQEPPPEPVFATRLPAGGQLPDFTLLDHHGAPVGPEIFDGRWNLVFFGFTHCPDICPLTLQVLAEAREQLARQGFEPLPRIVLVSVDPERDTPAQLAAYLGYFGTDTLGLTGDLDELRKLTTFLGIWFEKSQRGDQDYTVDHSAAVLVIGPDRDYRAVFNAPHEAGHFVRDLPLLVAAK